MSNTIGTLTPANLTPVSIGNVGPAGPQGPQGIPGPTGNASTVPGPSGPQGVQGLQGIQGVLGLPGKDGNTIISSNGVPDNTVGKNGDYFYDTNGHILWGPKASGAWPPSGIPLVGPIGPVSTTPGPIGLKGDPGAIGPVGPASTVPGPVGPSGAVGAAGTNGNTLLNGSGPPSTQGVNGDFYYDTSGIAIYGPKAANSWPSVGTSLIGAQGNIGPAGPSGAPGAASTVPGPQGVAGYSIQNGSGPPSNSIGNNGDIYYDYTNYNLYSAKSNGAWPNTYKNLVGPQGSVGATGSQGVAGTNGTNGINGTNGTNGNTVLNGTSAPTAAIGNNGDFYLVTTSNVLYGPKTAGAWPSSGVSLIGPQGPQGPSGVATVPNDLAPNSVVIAPISGDSTLSQLRVNNSSGTQMFLADSSGNTTAAGTSKAALFSTGQANVNSNQVYVSSPATSTVAAIYVASSGNIPISFFDYVGNLVIQGTANLNGPTKTSGTVTSSTAVGTPSFVSTQGFKSPIDAGYLYYTSSTALPTTFAAFQQTVTPASGSNVANYLGKSISLSHPGSVIGFTATLLNAITVATNIRVLVAGTATTTITIASGSTSAFVTYPKGQYTFGANTTIAMQASFSAATTQNVNMVVSGIITVEMGA